MHAALYKVAGTVMQSLHEGNDCRGAGGMTIVLTDAEGSEWTMTGNSAGNFWLDPETPVVLPYTARILDRSGRERVKQVAVDDGDCAACHTQEGANGAPGRILAPEAELPETNAEAP